MRLKMLFQKEEVNTTFPGVKRNLPGSVENGSGEKWISGMTEAGCVPLKTNLGRLVGAAGSGFGSRDKPGHRAKGGGLYFIYLPPSKAPQASAKAE